MANKVDMLITRAHLFTMRGDGVGMVHSGYDAAAMGEALRSLPTLWRVLKWAFS